MNKKLIEFKKREIEKNIEDLQLLIENEYGGQCEIDIDIDYICIQKISDSKFKNEIKSIYIKCSANI